MKTLKLGTVIQGYELIEFISSGATSDVWKVRDSSGRIMALKIFSPGKGLDGATIDLLFEEFKLTVDLNHPNVLKAEMLGIFENVPFIVMPYCEGGISTELSQKLLERKKLGSNTRNLFSEKEITEFIYQVADGLNHMHHKGIIHCDIKPENILKRQFEDTERFVLSDFGISTKLKQDIIKQTMPKYKAQTQLTPAYAAPEQFIGKTEYASDIFALGVILFELVDGKLPFGSMKPVGEKIQEGNEIPSLESSISEGLKVLISKCLERYPGDRPTAQDLFLWSSDFLENGNWTFLDNDSDSIDDISNTEYQREPAMTVSSSNIEKTPTGYYDFRQPQILEPQTQVRSIESSKDKYVFRPSKRKKYSFNWKYILVPLMLIGLGYSVFHFGSKYLSNRHLSMAEAAFWQGDMRNAEKYIRKVSYLNSKPLVDDKRALITHLNNSYAKVRPFSNGLAAVKKNGKWGFIDDQGRELFPCKYYEVYDFVTDISMACPEKNKCSIIDKYGTVFTKSLYQVIDSKNLNEVKAEYVIISNGKEVPVKDKYKYSKKSLIKID